MAASLCLSDEVGKFYFAENILENVLRKSYIGKSISINRRFQPRPGFHGTAVEQKTYKNLTKALH